MRTEAAACKGSLVYRRPENVPDAEDVKKAQAEGQHCYALPTAILIERAIDG